MSQENIERAYRGYDAFNRRDLCAFLGLADPEVDLTTRFGPMEGQPQYHGHDGVREWWEDVLGIFPDLSIEVLEVRDLGDLMLAALRVRGHGVDSDVPFGETVWAAGEWRDGKAIWWQFFHTEEEALEAAGLPA
jgi:ketosteroid isomerase-like protein